jgi:hypothetical protein
MDITSNSFDTVIKTNSEIKNKATIKTKKLHHRERGEKIPYHHSEHSEESWPPILHKPRPSMIYL